MKPTLKQLKDEIRLIKGAIRIIEAELAERSPSNALELEDEAARLESHLDVRQRRLRTIQAEEEGSPIQVAGWR